VRFNLHIDAPLDRRLPSKFLRLRGWAYAVGQDVQHVRLMVQDRPLAGVYGAARPDVRSAFPDAPSDHTGFEIRGRLPAGPCAGQLEFQTSNGVWHAAAQFSWRTPRDLRPWWLPGGNPADLVAFQLAGSPAHAPRPLQVECFPRTPSNGPHCRLTVVTPSFNQGRFLPETIRSVELQSDGAGAVEYLVQDGGSSDGSADVIAQGQARGQLWRREPDGGQSDAIARAFARRSSDSELMAWINSDDFYLPGALRYVSHYFARHPELDVIYGHRILVDEHSREIGRWFLPPHDNEVLRLNDFVPQETMFWRRRIWDKVGGIDPSFKFAMDWDLLLRFQAAGAKIVRVPYFLACFRIHAAQKTSAQMESVGQKEIDALRLRTFGRVLPPQEIENHPLLLRYLRKSAWIEFLWRRLGIRAR
jgi:glycosyltransferase involved in cell wall biosynthesis